MRKFLALFFFSITFISSAQILDDTTELVYGPTTTKFIYKSQILNNQRDYFTVDTSLYLFERQSFVDRYQRKYQNLGNFGTALFPVFYTPQETIGRTSGFNTFSAYSRAGNKIKYYDTKSPFIDLFAYLGGGNKNIVKIDFSRNVREGWNVGFDIHKITTDKLIANNGEADRQTVNTSFDIYTHYQNQKIPYQAVFYYTNLSHEVVEQGGVRFSDDSLISDLFELDNALTRLVDAQNQRKESTWHLYHDYRIAEQFQLYHTLDIYQEENTYKDFTDGTTSGSDYNTYLDGYNGIFQIDADSTYERSNFSSTTNEFGIKGDLSTIFYRAYFKFRSLDFKYFLLDPVPRTNETYLGGYARFNWREKFAVIGEAELLQGGEYSFKGKLRSDVLNVSYESKKFNVPFIYSAYLGNHYFWQNEFTPVFVNQLDASLGASYKFLTFRPKASFTAYNDWVYFDENQLPRQASSVAISTIGGEINAAFESKRKAEGFFLENEILTTAVSGNAANQVRIPELFYNGRYYWRGLLFGDNVPVEVGIDAHARSAYYANQYSPVLQQFYVQNEFELDGYFKTDVFINMRLDKFYFGIKWLHFDQPSDGGYFMTPYYPGQPRSVDLIIRWTFFD